MKRFVEGDNCEQVALLPKCVDDCVGQDSPVTIELTVCGPQFSLSNVR